MPIEIAEARRIADLARLDLDDDSIERYRSQLAAVLDYVARLDELDVSGVVPTSDGREAAGALRADRERASLSAEEATGNAPEAADGLFRVPQILERPASAPDDD